MEGKQAIEENKEALLGRARSGDRAALAELALARGPEVYRLALYLLHSEEEARDAAADIFARLYAAPGLLPRESFRPWLLQVAHNHCLNILRRRKTPSRRRWRPTNRPKCGGRRAVARLPEQERAIVILRFYQRLSYDEISAVLGIPKATVGTRLHRAREKLRKMLAHSEGGTENEAVP